MENWDGEVKQITNRVKEIKGEWEKNIRMGLNCVGFFNLFLSL